MAKYIIRLDDACPKRDIKKWDKIKCLLDKYNIRPLVGIIPNCKDPDMEKYSEDSNFWIGRVKSWKEKNWTLALHGYEHVFVTEDAGINPVNKKSEFAGLSLEEQREKIRNGIEVLRKYGIEPNVFFAPAHTFDVNTLEALKLESDIRIISDTPTNKRYCRYGMTFVPQQSGHVRKLPFNVVTFCYHPNTMKDKDFRQLEDFVKKYRYYFIDFPSDEIDNKLSLYDKLLMKIYYWRHK